MENVTYDGVMAGVLANEKRLKEKGDASSDALVAWGKSERK